MLSRTTVAQRFLMRGLCPVQEISLRFLVGCARSRYFVHGTLLLPRGQIGLPIMTLLS